MNSEAWGARKVVIVGAGAVGATFAYAFAQSGISDEIILSCAVPGVHKALHLTANSVAVFEMLCPASK